MFSTVFLKRNFVLGVISLAELNLVNVFRTSRNNYKPYKAQIRYKVTSLKNLHQLPF